MEKNISTISFRKIVIIELIAIALMGILGILFNIHNSGVATEFIELKTISVSKDVVHVTGEIRSKGKGYYGFSYRFSHGQLYIKPRCFWFGDGKFDITIVGDLNETNCIYFHGVAETDDKLIWTRKW